jgi:hypothetical protein
MWYIVLQEKNLSLSFFWQNNATKETRKPASERTFSSSTGGHLRSGQLLSQIGKAD